MPADWSHAEVEAIITDYFVMWEMDLQGLPYNKAEHNRLLRNLIPDRNRSAVEQKHRNISAVLWHLGYPYLRGYKPLPSYQNLLRTAVERRLAGNLDLNRLVASAVSDPVIAIPTVTEIRTIKVAAPAVRVMRKLEKEESQRTTPFVRRNYMEVEANNRSIGLAGEEFILRYERERLLREGKRKLAARVEHVALTKGDYLGFDILSFETNGHERLIEVKTTRYGSMTRFFASVNEVEVSEKHGDEYHLHRLFNFDNAPQFFVLSGSLRKSCQLKAINFSAVPN